MLTIRITLGRFVLLDLAALARVPEEPEEDEPEEATVLPFGFVATELAEPAPDPAFREVHHY